MSGCDLGKISWRNSNGGRGDINSNKKIEDNFSGSITYKIACNMNGQVANQPFCEKEVIIYRTEAKPIIKDDTKCSDFFQEATYEYKLGMAAGVQGSTPTYTPKEKAIYAGIDDFSANEVLLRLVSSNCPSNVVAWYDSKGTKISDKNIVSIPFPSTSPAVYTSECTIKLNNGNTLKCPSTATIHFRPDYIKDLNRILKNERTATLQNTEFNNARQDNLVSQTTETTTTNCGFMTTQKAVGDILKNLICDNGKLIIEAPITTEKVEILKNTILQNPIFEDKGITLPAITDEFLTKTSNEVTCQTAIEGLVKDVKGTSLKEDFNNLATDPNLIDEVMTSLLPCFGIFDDCDDIILLLKRMHEVKLSKGKLFGKFKFKQTGKTFTGTSFTIDGIDVERMNLIYLGEANKEYLLTMAEYEVTETGFIIKQNGEEVIKIVISFDDNNSSVKKDLKNYLFWNKENTDPNAIHLPLDDTCLRKYTCNSSCNCSEKTTTGTYGCVRCSTKTSECPDECPNHAHYGLDLFANDNTPCYAIADGEIVNSGSSVSYGNFILLKCKLNDNIRFVYYAHLNSITISSGKVNKGDEIGLTGHTGDVAKDMCEKERHLHIEIRLDDTINFRKFSTNEDPNIYIRLNCYK